jgi:hypothetical protein
MKFGLAQQIAAIETQLALMAVIFDKLVNAHTMRRMVADHELDLMRSVLDTLQRSEAQSTAAVEEKVDQLLERNARPRVAGARK